MSAITTTIMNIMPFVFFFILMSSLLIFENIIDFYYIYYIKIYEKPVNIQFQYFGSKKGMHMHPYSIDSYQVSQYSIHQIPNKNKLLIKSYLIFFVKLMMPRFLRQPDNKGLSFVSVIHSSNSFPTKNHNLVFDILF